MKTFLTILVLSIGIGMNAQQQLPPLVTVTGEGTVNIVPDKVVVEARVEHKGDKAAEVKKSNDAVIDAVIKYLRKKGIESKNVRTSYLNLRKDHNYQTGVYSYAANQTLSITIKNLENYEDIMSGLLETGVNGINGITFESSEIEKHKHRARDLAVLNAKDKANQFALTLGQTIGGAYQITEIETNNFQPMYRSEAMKMDSAGGQETLAPGQMEVSVNVTVAFHLR